MKGFENTSPDLLADALEASICKESFYEFVRAFWGTIIPEDPVWNWHISYLCAELQVMAERVFKGEPKAYDLVINISPGSTKSTICSRMFPAWVWTRMPTAKSICASYNERLALSLALDTRDIVESEKWQKLFGNIELRQDASAKSHFINCYQGERIATGVGGNITGEHGHFIIVDDPLNPEAAASLVELETVNRWMNETLPSRKVKQEVTPTILIMQRLHEDDPSARLLKRETRKVRHICLPAESTAKIRPRSLRKCYVDGLMDPIRLGRAVLAEKKEDNNWSYSAQYLQDPEPLEGGIFKSGRIVVDDRPAWNKFKALIRYWDKAGSSNKGAYTAGVLLGLDREGRWWVLNVVRGQWDAHEREMIIKQIAKVDGRKVLVGVEQEPGSGGKESAESTIRNLAGHRVVAHRPTGDKEQRAQPFASQVNGGNVRMVKGPWNEAYLEELQYFRKDARYKDQVDASSGAFSLLTRGRRAGGLR